MTGASSEGGAESTSAVDLTGASTEGTAAEEIVASGYPNIVGRSTELIAGITCTTSAETYSDPCCPTASEAELA
jgi:hypothetical protein